VSKIVMRARSADMIFLKNELISYRTGLWPQKQNL
jgi:hypothetical protein